MVMSLSRVLWKVHSKAPTVTASMLGTVLAAGEGYTTIRDSTYGCFRTCRGRGRGQVDRHLIVAVARDHVQVNMGHVLFGFNAV